METPSFSNSESLSFSEDYKCEEKNEVATQTESNMEDTPLQYLSNRVFQMEHLLRMVYARVRNTEMITKRNISVILDQNDQHFDKMMDEIAEEKEEKKLLVEDMLRGLEEKQNESTLPI